MDPNVQAPRVGIEKLPFELTLGIIQEIPDFDTLKAAVSSSPVFWRAYDDCRYRVLSKLLMREIDPTLLPAAVAVLRSAHNKPSPAGVRAILQPWLAGEFVTTLQWTLYSIGSLLKFHATVLYVGQDVLNTIKDTHPPSSTEVQLRNWDVKDHLELQGDLYRYELCCNMFRITIVKWCSIEVEVDERQTHREARGIIFRQEFAEANQRVLNIKNVIFRRLAMRGLSLLSM